MSACHSPVAQGFDIQIETGAHNNVIQVFRDIAGNIIGFEREWKDYRYFKNVSGKQLHMIPLQLAEWIDGPSAMTRFPGRYSAKIVSGFDTLEAPPGTLVISWNRPGWIVPARHIFLDPTFALHCKHQKAYAGVQTNSQSSGDMLSGKVIDPEVHLSNADLCPCGSPAAPGDCILPGGGTIACWILQYAACTAINSLSDQNFNPDGFDISDLYRMYDLGSETYRFCGSEQAMDCEPWP